MKYRALFASFLAAMAISTACKKGGSGTDPDGGAGDPCLSSSDCGGAFVCAGGSCQLEGSVGLGGPCWANRDCGTDLYCTPAGVCGPAGGGAIGDPCATGAECAKDLVCILYGFGGTCEMAGAGDLGDTCAATTDCIAGLACAADGTCKPPATAYPPFAGVDCLPEETPFRVYFEVPRAGAPPADFFRLPFPNDVRVRADGTLDLSDFPRPGPSVIGVDLVDLYADALEADFTGFSSVAAVTFRTSSELDFDSIGAGAANMHYIDITPSSPNYGDDRGRTYSYTTGRGKFICNHAFTVANDPHRPLRPGNTYAVYLTTAIRSAIGETPVQDADLAALLGATRPTGDADLGNAWDRYQVFRDYLADAAIAPATIAGVAVFTVQDTTGATEALAAAVQGTALPALSDVTVCDGNTTSPCDDGSARTCGDSSGAFWEIHGRFSVPVYQQGTAPYALPADGGQVDFASGVPVQNGGQDVCFVMTIPKTTMPAGGWPLLVYAHGTGGNFKNVVDSGISAAVAAASPAMATFSYDGVVHGERRNGHARDEDSLVFNIINPRGARGNHLQGAVDVMQAFRLGQVAPFAAGAAGTVDFDAANIYFFGHSQGGNVGVPAVAVTAEPRAAVFSGAGAFLSEGLMTKTSPVDSKAGLEFLLGEEVSKSHPMITLFQTYYDPVDTVNFAPQVIVRPDGVPAKHVFLTFATGMTDTFSPRSTIAIMARALEIPIASPVIESVTGLTVANRPVTDTVNSPGGPRTAAMFQYAPDGYDGHFVSTRNPDAVDDWVAFFTSAISAGTPAVP